jgi:hypothetical protein
MPLFDAIVFTVFDCGYVARSALEFDDSSQVRIEKIGKIISESKYGIHDISRTELDSETGLPRFNMPLELGLFLGAKRFGTASDKDKVCLILDRNRYRFQQFLSDIAGQDIRSHNDDADAVVSLVRDWLRNNSGRRTIPGGRAIAARYASFRERLPSMCNELQIDEDELTFNDYVNIVSEWLSEYG